MKIFRITRSRYAGSAYAGLGGRTRSGRWHERGPSITYASESRALAALEILVNLDPEDLPDDLVIVPADLPEACCLEIHKRDLPRNWRLSPSPDSTQKLGGEWLKRGDTLAMILPSAVIPEERNIVLNPEHSDFSRLRVGRPEPFTLDPRLRRNRRT